MDIKKEIFVLVFYELYETRAVFEKSFSRTLT